MPTRAALLRDVAGFMIAVLAAASFLTAEGPAPTAPALAAAVAIAAWVAWQDLADFTIPDGAAAGLALIGLAHRVAAGRALGVPVDETLLLALVDTALAGGGLLLVREVYFRRRGFDGLGFGDVKLAAGGAMLVGAFGFSLALGAASLSALAFAIARRPAGTPLGAVRVAFGAALGPAIALVYLAAAAGLAPAATG